MPSRLQFLAQRFEVVDFAVVRQPNLSSGIRHWLVAGSRQIDDRESTVPKTYSLASRSIREIDSVVVRSAMLDPVEHRFDQLCVGSAYNPTDATHSSVSQILTA